MITIISDFSYPKVGGTQKHVIELAEELSKKQEVTIISPVWGNEEKKYDLGRIQIKKFKLPFRRTMIRVIYYFIWLLKYGRQSKVINAHYLLPGIAGLIYAKLTRKKIYVTIHDYENITRGFPNNLFVKLLNQTNGVIATSQFLKQKLIRQGVKAKKVKVIPNWVELKKSGTKKKKNNTILFVGRVIRKKGVATLIKSIKHVKKKTKFKFIGPLIEKDLIKLAKKEGVSEKCEFTGFIPKKELENNYQNCITLILPSLMLEGFGFVLVEAMKYGKPVIGTRIGGVPETIGKAGLLVKPGDEKELSNAINKLLSDKKLYQKLSKEALKQVKKFNKKKVLTSYAKLLFSNHEK